LSTPRSPKAFPAPVPDSSGIPHVLEDQVLIAPFNDLATVEGIVATHADFVRDVHRVETKYYELSTRARRRRPGHFRRARIIGEMVRYLVTRVRPLPGRACSRAEP
jgi:hypothetical protein